MSVKAKIHLSELEMELVNNADWILTKQSIIKKVFIIFGEMNEVYKRISKNNNALFSDFDLTRNGKISKGENYLGLPYVMLDYPAQFAIENIAAIRTMFWWGNFFSVTLHISGHNITTTKISHILWLLRDTDFYICVNENEWQHQFENDNYLPIKDIDKNLQMQVCSRNFFKMSKKISLKNWEEVPGFLEESYKELFQFIGISFPAGEKAL